MNPQQKQPHNHNYTRKLLSLLTTLVLGLGLAFVLPFLAQTQSRAANPYSVSAAANATLQVAANGNDAGDCTGSPCASVSYALAQAANGDVINVAAGTYTDTFTVDVSVTIQGEDAATTILQAANAYDIAASRVVTISSGVTVTLESLTIRYGKAAGIGAFEDGGGIYISGTLTLLNSNVISNTAVEDGGGINNAGTLTLTNSAISYNTAVNDDGGGIDFDGPLELTNSTISNNEAGDAGGGIDNDVGALTLINTTVSTNTADYDGGGIFNDYGDVILINTNVNNNTAYSTGGGIFNWFNLSMDGGSISNNDAEAGGGLYSREAFACLNDVIIRGNTAVADGGGIFNDVGSLCLENSALISNMASGVGPFNGYGGGVYNAEYAGDESTLIITNTTVSGNAAVYGGGIYNQSSIVTLTYTTIASNTIDQRGGGDHARKLLNTNKCFPYPDHSWRFLDGVGICRCRPSAALRTCLVETAEDSGIVDSDRSKMESIFHLSTCHSRPLN